MISIFVRPDLTQAVHAVMKGDVLRIQKTEELPSFYGCFAEDEDALQGMAEPGYQKKRGGSVDALRKFFRDIRKSVGNREDMYLVLPDQLFPYIDVEEVSENNTADAFVVQATQESPENFSLVCPFESSPGQDHKTTIYAMRKNLLESIIEAASQEAIPLASIEAASLAAIRCMMKWNEEHILMECYKGRPIVLYSYSPLGGIFRMDTQYTPEQLMALSGGELSKAMEDTLSVREVNAEHSFETYNDDVRLTILYAGQKLLHLAPVKAHIAKPFEFPEYIDDRSDVGRTEDWLSVVGTLCQKFPDDFDGFSSTCPPFLSLRPGNILPEEVRLNTKVSQWRKTLKGFLSKAAVFLFLVCAAEGAGVFYYSSFEVPPSAKAEYEAAKKNESSIGKELVVIEQAKLEHEAPFTALQELVLSKKQEIHFTRFVVNDSGDDKWIGLEAFAADPVMFQDYIASLRGNPTFNNVSLTGISRDEGTGYVRGSFIVGKGKGRTQEAPKPKAGKGTAGSEKTAQPGQTAGNFAEGKAVQTN